MLEGILSVTILDEAYCSSQVKRGKDLMPFSSSVSKSWQTKLPYK